MSWREAVPVLDGSIVTVRELVPRDATALFELLSDPRVSAHMSAALPSCRAFEGFIEWTHRERAMGRGVCVGIVPHGLESAVGIIQLRTVEPTFCLAEW